MIGALVNSPFLSVRATSFPGPFSPTPEKEIGPGNEVGFKGY